MEAVDETWNDLSELYSVVAGERLKYWLATRNNMGEADAALEFNMDHPAFREQLFDYWGEMSGTEYGGHVLMDGEYELTDFGENWNDRVIYAQNDMMSNPDIPVEVDSDETEAEGRRHLDTIGDIFSVLGHAPDNKGMHPAGANVLHILSEGGGSREVAERTLPAQELPGEWLQDALGRFYRSGFITEEAYRSGSFAEGEDVLTKSAQEIHDEIVMPDYHWLDSYEE